MQERALTMFIHALIIGLILYFIMVFLMKQGTSVAEDRSVLIAALVLVYMVLFGHGLPTRVNPNIA